MHASQLPLVRLAGDLDYSRRMELESTLLANLDSSSIAVDMSQVTFVDSSAISTLIKALKAYRARGANLILMEPSLPVRKMLDITGLRRIFTIESAE